jgi:hypothetical protein
MISWKSCLHWLAVQVRSLRHPSLARPLDRVSDQAIDEALRRAKLARSDLFTLPTALPWHRVYMAHMLRAYGIDPVFATEARWQELKGADRRCARCASKGRCRSWLEQGGFDEAPSTFCPNASLFAAIAAEQRGSALSSASALQ